jgi:hypothetical protein
MPKSRKFSIEKYDKIKNILKENKIESYDLDNYIIMKAQKYKRYQGLTEITDEQIIEEINKKIEKKGEKTNDTTRV